jgi:hypothetical protein
MRSKHIIEPSRMRLPLLHALLMGLLLALLAVIQLAPAAPALADHGRLHQRELIASVHGNSHTAQANSEAPCIDHERGTQCTPCQHCSAPATVVLELLELPKMNVRQHSPPGLTQCFPASLFKPPRQIG